MKAALKLMVGQLGLTLFSDDDQDEDQIDSDIDNLTISGNVFVLDVTLSKLDGSITKVTLSASQLNSISQGANLYLTSLLQGCRMDEFEAALSMIAFLDKGTSHPQLDLFHCLAGLEADLALIYEKELTNNTPETVLLCGHGQPRFYRDNLGPSILYFFIPDADTGFLGKISVEEGLTNRFLPKSKAQSCFQHPHPPIPMNEKHLYSASEMAILAPSPMGVLVPSPSSPLVANASFVMHLEPPVRLTLQFVKSIISMGGVDFPVNVSLPWQGPTFESLVQPTGNISSSLSSKTPMIQLDKLYFTHVSQLLPLLKILRQAVAFDQVLQSLIRPLSTSLDIPSPLHLVGWVPMQSIQLLFSHRRPPFRYTITLLVGEGGVFSCLVGELNPLAQVGDVGVDSKEFDVALAQRNALGVVQAVKQFLDRLT
ncbi:hypothetical protein HDV03_004190 [Kappamyces sp. JEL0829]|nr:hypothetical protein HDV03_004190 [Kappamyces sp. JEL0829]